MLKLGRGREITRSLDGSRVNYSGISNEIDKAGSWHAAQRLLGTPYPWKKPINRVLIKDACVARGV
jgi:hypothetical protein